MSCIAKKKKQKNKIKKKRGKQNKDAICKHVERLIVYSIYNYP